MRVISKIPKVKKIWWIYIERFNRFITEGILLLFHLKQGSLNLQPEESFKLPVKGVVFVL